MGFGSHLTHSALTFGTGQKDVTCCPKVKKFRESSQSISSIYNHCVVVLFGNQFKCGVLEHVRN